MMNTETVDSSPLYVQVRNKIKEEIEMGVIKPDSKGILPGQQEFADSYNVGIMTVRRAIKDLETMGLVVSRRGKGLMLNSDVLTPTRDVTERSTRMRHIGVCFFDILMSVGNPVVSKMMSGVEAFARDHGLFLHVLSVPSLNVTLKEDALFSNFPFANLDGMILLSAISSSGITTIRQKQIPFVVNGLLADEDAICCATDPAMLSFLVVDAFLKRGRRDIVSFIGNAGYLGYPMQLTGHKLALMNYGVQFNPDYISKEDYDLDAAIAFVRDLLEKGEKVDAIAAFDDIMAARIYDYLHANGRPDILVAGRGNLDEYRDKVAITVDTRLRETGYDLTSLLVDLIDGIRPEHPKRFYEPTLIERDK